jgi:hypothetical protein
MKLVPSLVLFLDYVAQVFYSTNDISWVEEFCIGLLTLTTLKAQQMAFFLLGF